LDICDEYITKSNYQDQFFTWANKTSNIMNFDKDEHKKFMGEFNMRWFKKYM